MGKKSLIKSTTKKKADAKVEEEKTTQKAAAKKTTKKATTTAKKPPAKATKKSTTSKAKKSSAAAAKKKAAPASKKATPKKAAPKKTAAKKTPASKTEAAPKKAKAPKKMSVKELVFKKFEPTQALPEVMPAPKPAAAHVSAPPLISSSDPKEVARIRALLFQKFDVEEVKAAAKALVIDAKTAPHKAVTPKKVSVKELVFKKFEPTQALPEVMPAPKPAAAHVSAPPLIGSSDPKEAERIRALLFQKFDMHAVKAAAKAPAPVAQPAPAPKAEPESAAAAPARDTAEKEATAVEVEQPKADSAYVTMAPDAGDLPEGPMNRTVKIAVAAAAVIIFLLLAISYNNSSKYYIYPKDNAIEIWKGRFSPKDKEFFMVLHGTQVEAPIQETYTQKEVFPLVFAYFVNKADTLLEVPGLPDFEGIKTYLHKAEAYIVDNEMRTAVTTRLNNIERMTLLYKADVAISKNTDESLESAVKLLKAAGKLTSSSAQADEVAQKIEQARTQQAALKSAAE